ncbi:2-phosphosulfolactate phosphatase [Isosphaeraceae bacterium EP7]
MSAEPSQIFVHLLPALIPAGALRGGVAVVIDVLRATTAMVHGLAAGATHIVPCLEIDEARGVAAALPPGTAVLAGERLGVPIEGFDLGNSPADFNASTCRGKTLVITTTNGTRAIHASREAERVLVAGFVNLEATARALIADGRPVHLVCAGTDGQISLEDTLLAGAIAETLRDRGWTLENDPARIASILWFDVDYRIDEGETLAGVLSDGRGGRRVRELKLAPDIEAAATLNRFDLVAELVSNPPGIVAVPVVEPE